MTELGYISLEDTFAALMCELAVARLLLDLAAMNELAARLRELGYRDPMAAAEKIAAAAVEAEREMRTR